LTFLSAILEYDDMVWVPTLGASSQAGEVGGFAEGKLITTLEFRSYLEDKVKSHKDREDAAIVTYESVEAKLANKYHVFYAQVL
jgi:hypothetical protein